MGNRGSGAVAELLPIHPLLGGPPLGGNHLVLFGGFLHRRKNLTQLGRLRSKSFQLRSHFIDAGQESIELPLDPGFASSSGFEGLRTVLRLPTAPRLL